VIAAHQAPQRRLEARAIRPLDRQPVHLRAEAAAQPSHTHQTPARRQRFDERVHAVDRRDSRRYVGHRSIILLMPDDREAMELNRLHWDEAVGLHVASDFYDVAGFKAGKTTLMRDALAEVGDVRGKTLLHLQCHFGMDTLSWARAGASVTGVDFSPEAIKTARGLAQELGIEATFVESNVYDLPANLSGQFDVVFTSLGVLCWLPDVPEWARIAASYVRPGGVFYIMDGHPLFHSLDDEASAGELRLRYPYFPGPPITWDDDNGTYATAAKLQHHRTVEYQHSLGEIVTSLIDAGLQIEFLHEFDYSSYAALPNMTRGNDGKYRLPVESVLPFLFSIRAHKPA
jgi:2-polyprenyl-3-methyl-5-hydroxy-6-metoxy-1,4-benzoquinol methylase